MGGRARTFLRARCVVRLSACSWVLWCTDAICWAGPPAKRGAALANITSGPQANIVFHGENLSHPRPTAVGTIDCSVIIDTVVATRGCCSWCMFHAHLSRCGETTFSRCALLPGTRELLCLQHEHEGCTELRPREEVTSTPRASL